MAKVHGLYGGGVLDIGCGYGFFVNAFAKVGYKAVGIDTSQERLTYAKKYSDGDFIHGEINKEFVKEYSNHFHAVTLFHVLEHIREPKKFLKMCLEVVAPEGILLLEVPNLGDECLKNEKYRSFYWQRAHLSYFDASRLELLFRRTGLDSFVIRGVQRYGLRNLLHWLDKGKPQLKSPSFQTTEPILSRLESIYRSDRERALVSDTLIAEVRK